MAVCSGGISRVAGRRFSSVGVSAGFELRCSAGGFAFGGFSGLLESWNQMNKLQCMYL